MAASKMLRKVFCFLLTSTGCLVVGFGLYLLHQAFVFCPSSHGDSSAAAPSPGGDDFSVVPDGYNTPDGFYILLSRTAKDVVAVVVGGLGQLTFLALFGDPFFDDEEEAAAGAAKKTGYVAIDDVQAGGGKN